MRAFTYDHAADLDAALAALNEPDAALIAGGTELVNWLKEGIESPGRVVDITGLPLDGVELTDDGLQLGALARMSDVAAHPRCQRDYPVIAGSLLQAASPQLRNMATIGGNLLQRTRCPYFRADVPLPCNKRRPGSGCSALQGDTGSHAIFGWSEGCVATHPSDLAVALAALDAQITALSVTGSREIPATEFHRLPGDEPHRHTDLASDELITSVTVPGPAPRSHYLKIRERVSYEFAVVSAAAVVDGDGPTITTARLALGGVAHRPWRLFEAEAALAGTDLADTAGLRSAIATSFADARPLPDNEYKIELAQLAAVRALQTAGQQGAGQGVGQPIAGGLG